MATTSRAASSIFSRVVIPIEFRILFPSSKLVPCILTTRGFFNPTTFFTSTIPLATSSHLVIPASILTNILLTFWSPELSVRRSRRAQHSLHRRRHKSSQVFLHNG